MFALIHEIFLQRKCNTFIPGDDNSFLYIFLITTIVLIANILSLGEIKTFSQDFTVLL